MTRAQDTTPATGLSGTMLFFDSGQERTEAEYTGLLRQAGWRKVTSHHTPGNLVSVIEGACG